MQMNKLSIILPSFNEPNIKQVENDCKELFPSAEVIVVNDRKGLGKGWAVRKGIKKAKGDLIAYIDGDGDIFVGELFKLLRYIKEYDIVIGIKEHKKMPFKRAVVSAGYRFLIRLLFKLPVVDSQTGIKLFHRDTIPEFMTNGFAFVINSSIVS